MENKDLSVSVALCTYNGERFIRAQLESILNQSVLPDEVVVCDDASTDNTLDILSDMASSSSVAIEIITNGNNIGYRRNFEQAITRCTGDIIFLSDQDDVWLSKKIETMLRCFTDNPEVGLVYSDAVLADEFLKPGRYTLFERRKSLRINEVREASLLIRGVGINGCTMAIKSSLRELVLPLSERWGHDHWIAFIAHAVTGVRPVGEVLMYYRRHGDSAGNSPLLNGWSSRLKAGLDATVLSAYTKDRCRWEAMAGHLVMIERNNALSGENHKKVRLFIMECERRLEFAQARELLKSKSPVNRLIRIFHLLRRGDYHRYLGGVESAAKDLIPG